MTHAAALAPALRDASRVVARVAAGRSLADELAASPADSSARGALIDLAHGTLRRYGRVQAIVTALSRRREPDATLQALLWCALYALESGRYTDYTVVDQAVRACGLLERWNAKGYVNGLLRSYARDRAAVEAQLRASEEALYQHPQWWIDLLRDAYPAEWKDVLGAGNAQPPMTLRVNRRRTDPERYAERLAEAGMETLRLGPSALQLVRPLPVERLPGFAEGEVSVQDAGAQRAAELLALCSGQRVLDACAAPGGKTAHLLELADVALTALDLDPERCERIRRNLARLSLLADVRAADCTEPRSWWDGVPFDRILADVPCSASGVVRRHPDAKWLRRESDVKRFAERQRAILAALWRLLAPGGKLLYVTCSVFPQENQLVVDAFLTRAEGAEIEPLADRRAQQWLPGEHHDGFYCALIRKKP